MKHCNGCDTTKRREEFYTRKGDKPTSRCKACMSAAANRWRSNNRERAAENMRNLRARRSAADARYYFGVSLWKYGITVDEYDAMFEAQNGQCAFCFTSEDLCIDHCHESGQVRWLLCRKCNSGLGMFNDDPELLVRAGTLLAGRKN